MLHGLQEQEVTEKAGNVGYPGNLGMAGLPAFLVFVVGLFLFLFGWPEAHGQPGCLCLYGLKGCNTKPSSFSFSMSPHFALCAQSTNW